MIPQQDNETNSDENMNNIPIPADQELIHQEQQHHDHQVVKIIEEIKSENNIIENAPESEIFHHLDHPIGTVGDHDREGWNIEELPLEIRVHILWYCCDGSLVNFGQTNRFYNNLIFGKDENDDLSGYRNTIWRVRLLQLLNLWIDKVNSNVINNCIDTNQLENLTEKSLDSYIEKQVFHGPNFRYSHLVMQLQRITFKFEEEANVNPETGLTIKGRTIRNNNVKEWNSFLCNNFIMTNRIENLSGGPFSFKGYEFSIDEYHICGNTWKLVFGIGTDYENFNNDKATTQFLSENSGIGYVVENQHVKILGSLKIGTDMVDVGPVKVGDRYGLSIDFEKNRVYFFKNGLHVLTVESPIGETTAYNPIIALCPKKTITIYPLLSEYPLNEKAVLRSLFVQ